MRSRFVTFFICLLIFMGCRSEVDEATERENLLETDRQFSALSTTAGAADAFLEYLDSAAVQISSSGAVHGKENIFNTMKPSDTNYSLLWEPQFAEVSRCADMGWTWGTYVMTKMADSSQVHGHYLNVWIKKSDGTWRVVADIGNVKGK